MSSCLPEQKRGKCLACHAREQGKRKSPKRQRTFCLTSPRPRKHSGVLYRRHRSLETMIAPVGGVAVAEGRAVQGAEGWQMLLCRTLPAVSAAALGGSGPASAGRRRPSRAADWAPAWVRERRALGLFSQRRPRH